MQFQIETPPRKSLNPRDRAEPKSNQEKRPEIEQHMDTGPEQSLEKENISMRPSITEELLEMSKYF